MVCATDIFKWPFPFKTGTRHEHEQTGFGYTLSNRASFSLLMGTDHLRRILGESPGQASLCCSTLLSVVVLWSGARTSPIFNLRDKGKPTAVCLHRLSSPQGCKQTPAPGAVSNPRPPPRPPNRDGHSILPASKWPEGHRGCKWFDSCSRN